MDVVDAFSDINPADPSDVLARFARCDSDVVNMAVKSASSAFAEWNATAMPARGAILARAARRLEDRSHELAQEIVREVGKPLAEARDEVLRAQGILEYFAGQTRQPQGETFASDDPDVTILTFRRPLGVVALITPWNLPLAIPIWKLAPALAYGNTVVLKPSEASPLLALRIAEALDDANLPSGVLNVVYGDADTGRSLVAHRDVRAVSFTGSSDAGHQIAMAATARHAKVQTEMGGKNAVIVLADADLSKAADLIIAGAFGYAGQKCTATSRVIVGESIATRLTELLVDRVKRLEVGNPSQESTRVGPLIDQAAVDRTLAYVARALQDGCQLLAGGGRPNEKGYFVEPTILVAPNERVSVARDEIFGPVLVVICCASDEDAVEICNSTEFGLVASVCTNMLSQALRMTRQLEVGVVKVNSATPGVEPQVPFGGWRRSGNFSPEQGLAARDFYSDVQAIYVRGE